PSRRQVEKAVIQSLRSILDTLYLPYQETHDLIGFKEVRYGEGELTLFRKCYPDSKIILLVRNPIDVWRSLSGKMWNSDPLDKTIGKWNRNVAFYFDFSQKD